MKPALTYFALVFAAGFALGMVRVPLLVPRLGERSAELLEMPIMAVVIYLAARYVVAKFSVSTAMSARLRMGFVALFLMLAAEIGLAMLLQQRSLADYLASRDPVSGSVYLGMLGVFALMPWLLGRLAEHRTNSART